MDSMEINKAFGAVLTAGIAFLGGLAHRLRSDPPA